jgi:hypothetical protein
MLTTSIGGEASEQNIAVQIIITARALIHNRMLNMMFVEIQPHRSGIARCLEATDVGLS